MEVVALSERKDLKHCLNCNAYYCPGVWQRVVSMNPRHSTATPMDRVLGNIPEDECPICGAKEMI